MRQVAIPREVYTGSCNQLFDFLAEALVHFIKEQNKVGCGMVPWWFLCCRTAMPFCCVAWVTGCVGLCPPA